MTNLEKRKREYIKSYGEIIDDKDGSEKHFVIVKLLAQGRKVAIFDEFFTSLLDTDTGTYHRIYFKTFKKIIDDLFFPISNTNK